jgi:uncharacterized protein YlbG (UPF0298 family)
MSPEKKYEKLNQDKFVKDISAGEESFLKS